LNVIKFLSNYILFDEINKSKKTNINQKLSHHNFQNSSPGKEDQNYNLNNISEYLIEDKYLEIFYQILSDIKNYVFWINHKNYIEMLIRENQINLINTEIERNIYIENFFIIKELPNQDMILLKSLLWDLYKNLIEIIFKKKVVKLLKQILLNFKIFMKKIDREKKNIKESFNYKYFNLEYKLIGKMFLRKNYEYQINKIKKIFDILNILNEIIFYREIKIDDLLNIDFTNLRENLIYSLIVINNLEKVNILN